MQTMCTMLKYIKICCVRSGREVCQKICCAVYNVYKTYIDSVQCRLKICSDSVQTEKKKKYVENMGKS